MLGKMQILTKDQIVYSSVERQPFAYVVYDLDYQKNIAIVKEYCECCRHSLGRQVCPVRVPEHGWLYPERHGFCGVGFKKRLI